MSETIDLPMDAAVVALRAAIEKNDSVRLRLTLIEYLFKKNELTDALNECESAIRVYPNDGELLRTALELAEELDDTPRAEAYRAVLGVAVKPAQAQQRNGRDNIRLMNLIRKILA